MKFKTVKILFIASLGFVILVSLGFVVSIKRFSKDQGVRYLKNEYPKAANIKYLGEKYNSNLFVVVDSNYNINLFTSSNVFCEPSMIKIQ